MQHCRLALLTNWQQPNENDHLTCTVSQADTRYCSTCFEVLTSADLFRSASQLMSCSAHPTSLDESSSIIKPNQDWLQGIKQGGCTPSATLTCKQGSCLIISALLHDETVGYRVEGSLQPPGEPCWRSGIAAATEAQIRSSQLLDGSNCDCSTKSLARGADHAGEGGFEGGAELSGAAWLHPQLPRQLPRPHAVQQGICQPLGLVSLLHAHLHMAVAAQCWPDRMQQSSLAILLACAAVALWQQRWQLAEEHYAKSPGLLAQKKKVMKGL